MEKLTPCPKWMGGGGRGIGEGGGAGEGGGGGRGQEGCSLPFENSM